MISTFIRSARRISSIRLSRLIASSLGVTACALLVGTATVHAQTTSTPVTPVGTPDRVSAKRTILEDAAKNFERLAASEKDAGKRTGYLTQAGTIRKRLKEGDFQAGIEPVFEGREVRGFRMIGSRWDPAPRGRGG